MSSASKTCQGHYDFIDHPADIVVRAHGATLEKAFATAATAMFDILTGCSPITGRQKVEFDVQGIDRENLLVSFLSHLIAIHEIERLVLTDFVVAFKGDELLKATGWGEPFDDTRHGGGIQVKAVSYHMIEIMDGRLKGTSHVQVLFDV